MPKQNTAKNQLETINDIEKKSAALVVLGLGANLGENPAATLQSAADAVSRITGVHSTRMASLYASAPVDAPGPHYTNTAIVLRTTLSPLALLDQTQAIETAFGRKRKASDLRNAPRTLDIDLLWYDGIEINTPRLVLPHPRMHLRAFVLMPMAELLGPDFALKTATLAQWIEKCRDQTCSRLIPTF